MAFLRAERVVHVHPSSETELDDEVLMRMGRIVWPVPNSVVNVAGLRKWLKDELPLVGAVLVPGDGWYDREHLPDVSLPVSFTLHVRESEATSIRGHDSVEKDVRDLLTSIPSFPLDGDRPPAADELNGYLMDFSCLHGNVPIVNEHFLDFTVLSSGKKPFFNSTSELGALIADLVRKPLTGDGEMVASFRLVRYVDMMFVLTNFAPLKHQLEAHLVMDKVPERSSQSARCRKRKRPNAFINTWKSLLVSVEVKEKESAFEVAVDELSDKMNRVPDWVFGSLQFTLGIAVGGSVVQLWMKRPSLKAEVITRRFDLTLSEDRVTLVLLFIKLYSVMLSMARLADVDEQRMLPLFIKHQRQNSCLEFDAEGCVKTIEKWEEFRDDFGADLRNVNAAYAASKAVRQLVKADVSPKVTDDGRYIVRTRPLGIPAEFTLKNEETKQRECKKMVRDVLHALAGLHEAKLVHRDVRLPNIIWWPEECYVLIDLETAANVGVTMEGDLWTDYTSKTLYRGKYVATSDLHQLGLLLESLSPTGAEQFVRKLKSHSRGLTAKSLLTHPWLVHT